jgi:hypothetical protein
MFFDKPHSVEDYALGLDLGQMQDHSAIAVIERREEYGELSLVTYEKPLIVTLCLRHLERVPLQTPYPEVVERVREVLQNEDLRRRTRIVADGTGVGPPVVDLLREIGCPLTPVNIIGGAKVSHGENGWMRVPKRDLIVGLQVHFEAKRLRIAEGLPGAEDLLKELMAMRARTSDRGHTSYSAPDRGREGPHDDLVLAVALAAWRAGRKRRPLFSQGNIGITG